MIHQTVGFEEELVEGGALRFEFRRDGIPRRGFVVRFRGRLVAYENICRHLPLPLAGGEDRFFSGDGRHLVCRNHGALFDPSTGLCVRGPCAGASLWPLAVGIRSGKVWVEIQENDPVG